MNSKVIVGALVLVTTLAACDGAGGTDTTPSATPPASETASETATPTSEAPTEAPTTSEPATPTESGSEATDAGSAAPTEAGPTSAATTAAAEAFEPFTVEVGETGTDLTSRIQVELDTVEVRPNGLIVSVSSFNDTNEAAALAVRPDSVIIYDVDNRRYYTLRAPEDNPTLEFGPSEELSADIAFPAAFDEPPTQIEVMFNYRRDPLRPVGNHVGGDAEPLQLLFAPIRLDPDA